jgi:hypothetical protein
MALSTLCKYHMAIALNNSTSTTELAAAIDATSARVATVIAALGATSDLSGVDGTGSNAAPLAGTEARLDAIETKVDALIAALKTAGLMASS